ncbi:MAG: SWF/SNF helicase family protein, partial [Duncaniella sp.]|nr:SWF/SNF helicase family protein [Duncaniella sp.]
NDRDCKVLLMTLKTGGVGLNLTSADTVFIFEPWWNKAAEEQAVNRLHRIGQKAKVMSYSIITHDTIEEKIMQLQQQKAQLFDSLINSDSSATKLLTEEDINFILS